jgi:hypothetical protein
LKGVRLRSEDDNGRDLPIELYEPVHSAPMDAYLGKQCAVRYKQSVEQACEIKRSLSVGTERESKFEATLRYYDTMIGLAARWFQKLNRVEPTILRAYGLGRWWSG